MAYSATLANDRGLIDDKEHRRLLNLFSRAGLSMDHEDFNEEILAKATAAILKTRDGLLRAAVPAPIGTCVFINDLSAEEMNATLRRHKQLMKEYPRNGLGLDAFVDASDTVSLHFTTFTPDNPQSNNRNRDTPKMPKQKKRKLLSKQPRKQAVSTKAP